MEPIKTEDIRPTDIMCWPKRADIVVGTDMENREYVFRVMSVQPNGHDMDGELRALDRTWECHQYLWGYARVLTLKGEPEPKLTKAQEERMKTLWDSSVREWALAAGYLPRGNGEYLQWVHDTTGQTLDPEDILQSMQDDE